MADQDRPVEPERVDDIEGMQGHGEHIAQASRIFGIAVARQQGRKHMPAPGKRSQKRIVVGQIASAADTFAVTTPGVFLYYPGRRQALPKLPAFVEHVKYRSGHGAAVQLCENCARSTLQTLDPEAAFSSSLFTGPLLYYIASAIPAAAAARVRRFIKIPYTRPIATTRSCPHLMTGSGAQTPSDKQQGLVLPPTASLSACASPTARHNPKTVAITIFNDGRRV
jgi:hypothetical protein